MFNVLSFLHIHCLLFYLLSFIHALLFYVLFFVHIHCSFSYPLYMFYVLSLLLFIALLFYVISFIHVLLFYVLSYLHIHCSIVLCPILYSCSMSYLFFIFIVLFFFVIYPTVQWSVQLACKLLISDPYSELMASVDSSNKCKFVLVPLSLQTLTMRGSH